MSSEEWDANSSPEPVRKCDKWEGEDEDEDALDNWDDENEEVQTFEVKPVVKKLTLKQKIALKEEKRKAEKLAEQLEREDETPEEISARKRREKEMQEESDLMLAADTFGIDINDETTEKGEIDAFKAETSEDFTQFNELLVTKISSFSDSEHYSNFIEKLSTDLVMKLNVATIKKLGQSFTSIANEITKAEKSINKPKNKKGKGKLYVTKNDDMYSNFDDYNDMDDFI